MFVRNLNVSASISVYGCPRIVQAADSRASAALRKLKKRRNATLCPPTTPLGRADNHIFFSIEKEKLF